MKRKYEGKDLLGLIDLPREQRYSTLDEVKDLLPQGVTSPGDLKAELESVEGMDIEVLDEVPGESAGAEAGVEPNDEGEEESVDNLSESPDPVRLYLKEMGKFKLLSREAEVEVGMRFVEGEKEVQVVLVKSPFMLDYIIRIGAQVEAGEADPCNIFEDSEEAGADENKGPEADEAQHLLSFAKKLATLRDKLKETDEALAAKPGPRRKFNLEQQRARLQLQVSDELKAMQLSPKIINVVKVEMTRLLEEYRRAQSTIDKYERATGHGKNQLLKKAGEVRGRRHLLKANGTCENPLDIAARIRAAQKQIKQIERRVKASGDEFARSIFAYWAAARLFI